MQKQFHTNTIYDVVIVIIIVIILLVLCYCHAGCLKALVKVTIINIENVSYFVISACCICNSESLSK